MFDSHDDHSAAGPVGSGLTRPLPIRHAKRRSRFAPSGPNSHPIDARRLEMAYDIGRSGLPLDTDHRIAQMAGYLGTRRHRRQVKP